MKRELIYNIFSDIPVIRTERLTLRRIHIQDYEDMYDYARRSDVTEYLTWNPHPNKEYTRDYLEYVSTKYNVGEFYDWGVILNACDRMIGTCGFTSFNTKSDTGEIGYVINPDYHGYGYATEAVKSVIKFGFEKLGLERIEARYMTGNYASRKVMEKNGMSYEGVFRHVLKKNGIYKDVAVCSILREEYYQ